MLQARVEYDLALQPFKRPNEPDFQKVILVTINHVALREANNGIFFSSNGGGEGGVLTVHTKPRITLRRTAVDCGPCQTNNH